MNTLFEVLEAINRGRMRIDGRYRASTDGATVTLTLPDETTHTYPNPQAALFGLLIQWRGRGYVDFKQD